MKIYGYARVSTKEQNTASQIEAIKSRYTNIEIIEEQASGKSLDRPEFQKLLAKASKCQDKVKIVVRELSRLGRTQGELMTMIQEYQSKGVEFEILNIGVDTATASGKMILGILASVAQMERELMLERQALGIKQAQKDGKFKGKQQTQATIKKCKEALAMIEMGVSKEKSAKAVGIGIATLYRYIKRQD